MYEIGMIRVLVCTKTGSTKPYLYIWEHSGSRLLRLGGICKSLYTNAYIFLLAILQLLTIEHMAMFVVKSIHIQINGPVYESLNRMWCHLFYPIPMEIEPFTMDDTKDLNTQIQHHKI